MDIKVSAVFMIFGFGLISSKKYHYIQEDRNWIEAQQYCRKHFNDLATFESEDDVKQLERPSSMQSPAWIGLWDDDSNWRGFMTSGANSWRWSTTGLTSTTGFNRLHVDFWKAKETCVYILHETWTDEFCDYPFPFLCYTDLGDRKQYFRFELQYKWKQAQAYCRVNYTDLAMIENSQDYRAISYAMKKTPVWIGLYRVPFMWSDGSSSTFKKWTRNQPSNSNRREQCVAENPDHTWDDKDCSLKYPYICQGDKQFFKHKILLRFTVQTLADLSDPGTQAKLLLQMKAHMKKAAPLPDLNLVWHVRPKTAEKDPN
ncbi:unnamed protein product [Ophioblennius macclurei]